MCTTTALKMPDSNQDDEVAVKLGVHLTDDNDNVYFKSHIPQVMSPSLYVEEEKRLAGLESEDTDDEGTSAKKKKKKHKKRKSVPMEGVLDVKLSKKQKKQSNNTTDHDADTTHPKHNKEQSKNVIEQKIKGTGTEVGKKKSPKKPKKQKNQNVNVHEDGTNQVDDAAVHKQSSKKHKKHKQNGNVHEDGTNQEQDVEMKPDMKPDVKPEESPLPHAPAGSVYRQGMSLSEAIHAKHEAKKRSRTSKWRKNRPIDKEVNRRKARIEEKLEKLKAKCEELKARKNLGQFVMRREKRLMSKEKKLSTELGFISGSKKERKRQLLERRMTSAEGLAAATNTPPILNSNGAPVRSKFDFSTSNEGKSQSKFDFSSFSTSNDEKSHQSSNLHGRDYKKLLSIVEKRQGQVEELKEKNADKGRKLEEKRVWETMMSRARGEKVKDDPQLLKKAIKKAEKNKEKRKKKWDERVARVADSMDMRQRKRQANLDKRKADKQDKKRKKAIKKGRYIPGFG